MLCEYFGDFKKFTLVLVIFALIPVENHIDRKTFALRPSGLHLIYCGRAESAESRTASVLNLGSHLCLLQRPDHKHKRERVAVDLRVKARIVSYKSTLLLVWRQASPSPACDIQRRCFVDNSLILAARQISRDSRETWQVNKSRD